MQKLKPIKFSSQNKVLEKEGNNNTELKTVLYVTRDKGGCGFYRCSQPASFLKSRGLMNTIIDHKIAKEKHILEADIIVFQESGSTVSVEAMNFAIKNKKPVVIEIDDFLHKVSPHNVSGYGAWNPGTLYLHRFVQQLYKASAITVSTPQLARELFPYNENIFVIPNFLNEDKWDQKQIKKQDGIIRIGWAGGNAHKDDLLMISKVIEKIIRDQKFTGASADLLNANIIARDLGLRDMKSIDHSGGISFAEGLKKIGETVKSNPELEKKIEGELIDND